MYTMTTHIRQNSALISASTAHNDFRKSFALDVNERSELFFFLELDLSSLLLLSLLLVSRRVRPSSLELSRRGRWRSSSSRLRRLSSFILSDMDRRIDVDNAYPSIPFVCFPGSHSAPRPRSMVLSASIRISSST